MNNQNIELGADHVKTEQPSGLPLEWVEDVESDLPESIRDSERTGSLPCHLAQLSVKIGIREWPAGREHRFEAHLSDRVLDILVEGAEKLGKPTLPPSPVEPFDALRSRQGHDWGSPLDLHMPLWLALATGRSRHFAIEYKLAIQINAKWGIVDESTLTPRQLLTAFAFDPVEFSLYRANNADLLPPDQILNLKRGDRFEAQRDGKYGFVPGIPGGLQTLDQDVGNLRDHGIDIRTLSNAGQTYVEVRGLEIAAPPWSGNRASILIAVPSTYPSGGLDAFYLELTVNQGGSIPYQQSVVAIDGRSWGLISWHYADGRPWNPTNDDLASHITHCHGFFLAACRTFGVSPLFSTTVLFRSKL